MSTNATGRRWILEQEPHILTDMQVPVPSVFTEVNLNELSVQQTNHIVILKIKFIDTVLCVNLDALRITVLNPIPREESLRVDICDTIVASIFVLPSTEEHNCAQCRNRTCQCKHCHLKGYRLDSSLSKAVNSCGVCFTA